MFGLFLKVLGYKYLYKRSPKIKLLLDAADATFWTTFGKNWATVIPTSDHTVGCECWLPHSNLFVWFYISQTTSLLYSLFFLFVIPLSVYLSVLTFCLPKCPFPHSNLSTLHQIVFENDFCFIHLQCDQIWQNFATLAIFYKCFVNFLRV